MVHDPEHNSILGRMTDLAIEHQLVAQASAHREAAIDEVVSFLSEHGLGDEADPGRVSRCAQRLVNEGTLVEKNGKYRIAEMGVDEAGMSMELAKQAFLTPWEDEQGGTGP